MTHLIEDGLELMSTALLDDAVEVREATADEFNLLEVGTLHVIEATE